MAEQDGLTTNTTEQRDRWAGRGAFVMAAIGSAIGLGNLWGFPYKVFEGGGGAFLIPYFIALLVLGLPLLICEYAVGHWAQQSPPGAFTRIARQYRFLGWWVAGLAFLIVTYYTVILAYCVLFLVDSVQGLAIFGGQSLPWGGSAGEAESYFFNTMLAHESGMGLGGLQWPIVAGLAISWGLIYLSLFKGVKWVGKVVLITVPLPWLMLLVLAVRGLTLEGAVSGLKFYLEPEWAKLAEARTWRLAFEQVFFTLSLGFAVMLSYASFLHRRSDLNNNALIILLSNSATSFIAGLAVFSTLGAMAVATVTPVTEVVASGPGLTFVAFPFALAQLPAGQAVFSLIFFIALLTLGVDSAFSIVEACLASVTDARGWARKRVLPVICVTGFFLGLLFCAAGGGLNWLGLIDSVVLGPFGVLLGAVGMCIIVGYGYDGAFVHRMLEHANDRSDWRLHRWWVWTIRYFAPGLLIAVLVWSLSDTIANENWSALIASGIVLLIPLGFWLFARPRANEQAGTDPRGAVRLATVLGGAVALSLAIGGLRWWLATTTSPEGMAAAPPTPAPPPSPASSEAELDTSGYIVLATAFLVYCGGLIWCFWRAILAAGGRDTEIQDEPSI